MKEFEEATPRALEAFAFLASTTKSLPVGRYKQYGPLWQGGRGVPVLTTGARKNPLVLAKSYDLMNYLYADLMFNGVLLTRQMEYVPMILGASPRAQAMMWKEGQAKYLAAKLDPTTPADLRRFGPCNTIVWYHMAGPPDDENN